MLLDGTNSFQIIETFERRRNRRTLLLVKVPKKLNLVPLTESDEVLFLTLDSKAPAAPFLCTKHTIKNTITSNNHPYLKVVNAKIVSNSPIVTLGISCVYTVS